MAISRCAVDWATPRASRASDSRISPRSRNISSSRSALSTDSIGYCGRGLADGGGAFTVATLRPRCLGEARLGAHSERRARRRRAGGGPAGGQPAGGPAGGGPAGGAPAAGGPAGGGPAGRGPCCGRPGRRWTGRGRGGAVAELLPVRPDELEDLSQRGVERAAEPGDRVQGAYVHAVTVHHPCVHVEPDHLAEEHGAAAQSHRFHQAALHRGGGAGRRARGRRAG